MLLLLFYAITAVFHSYHGSDRMYAFDKEKSQAYLVTDSRDHTHRPRMTGTAMDEAFSHTQWGNSLGEVPYIYIYILHIQ